MPDGPVPDRLPAPVLVCSHTIPPAVNGQALVIGRLIGALDPADVRLVTFSPGEQSAAVDAPAAAGGARPPASLACLTYRLRTEWRWGGESSYPLRHVRALRNYLAEALSRARQLVEIARGERCGAIVCASGPYPDLLAGMLAAKRLRIAFMAHVMDDWRSQVRLLPSMSPWASVLDTVVAVGATELVVPNAALASLVHARTRRRPVVVSNPPDPIWLQEPIHAHPWPCVQGEIGIVYPGQVYDAQAEGLRRLLQALERPGLENVTLHLYGDSTTEWLERWGVTGRVQNHGLADAATQKSAIERADILFQPLSFSAAQPHLIRTASPTKLAEYLVSGRPILLNAPPDSAIAALAHAHGFAEVVDTPSVDAIAEAIRRIATDEALRRRRAVAARAAATLLFSPAETTERFRRVVVTAVTRHRPAAAERRW